MTDENVQSPEEREAAFDFAANQLMNKLLSEMRADPMPVKENYREQVSSCIVEIQALADERGGLDCGVWFNYQIALAYDHFVSAIPEFENELQESLKNLSSIIGDLPDQDLIFEWKHKASQAFT